MSDYPIRTEALSKTYRRGFLGLSGTVEALKSLTLEVPAGTVFGFLGPNGAGKTTTIKTLLGLLRPSGGQAWLMDVSVTRMDARQGLGYMPEAPAVYNDMTGEAFLQWLGQLSGMADDELAARIPVVLDEVGMTAYAGDCIGTYSRGRKQRIELAQALLSTPTLLILDEPLSGLDPTGRRSVCQLLTKYRDEYGTTVFFSSHILADVEDICDWIAILREGELQTVGRMDELLAVRHVEVSARGLKREGTMFIEKMGTYTQRDNERFAVFLEPDADVDRVKELFIRYGGTEVEVKKHCTSLEEFFTQTLARG